MSIFKNLWLKYCFLFRNVSTSNQENTDQTVYNIVLQYFKSRQSAWYRVVYSYTIAWIIANCFISRDQIIKLNQELDPISIASQTARTYWQQSCYCIKDPNRVWSIDRYNKLTRFGIEIYSIIDTYSRFIIDCYIGIGTR